MKFRLSSQLVPLIYEVYIFGRVPRGITMNPSRGPDEEIEARYILK
jgi:hypothetical protein